MPKFLPGYTHAIVKTPKDKMAMDKLNGAIALVALCFASDDDCMWVTISKMDGPTAGVIANLPGFTFSGRPLSSIKGKLANEMKLNALMAFDKVKQQYGVKWDKQYRVLEKGVEEIGATNG